MKEVAGNRGIDRATEPSKEKQKRLPGTTCLPTKEEIIDEKKRLVETGELTIGEPCTPML